MIARSNLRLHHRAAGPATPTIAVAVAVGWGCLAFGAVYPWGYWPLIVLCATAAALGFLQHARSTASDGRLVIGAAVLVTALVIQTIPLPGQRFGRPNPAHSERAPDASSSLIISQSNLEALGERHTVSIDPRATWRGVIFVVTFAVFLLGTSRGLNRRQTRWIVLAVAALGLAIAVVGITQQAAATPKIYGVWDPYYGGQPFGPFVNRNHFAGWMLMAIPLVTGYFLGRLRKSTRLIGPTFRERVLWLATADASQLALLALLILVMAVSVILSFSRSGVVCLTLALGGLGLMATKHLARPQRLAAAVGLTILFAVGIALADQRNLFERFAADDTVTFGERSEIWADALQMIRRFPLFGIGFNTYSTVTAFPQRADVTGRAFEAHSDVLQVAAEGGLLLTSTGALVIWLFVAEFRRRSRAVSVESVDYWIRAGAAAGLLAIAAQELVDFSLQIPGNAALFVTLCSIVVRTA